MKRIIEESLAKSFSYQSYRDLVSRLVSEGKSTGPNQSEALTHYSLLNEKRMDRLDKKISLKEETVKALSSISKKQTWLLITEGWCGDAAQNVPVINKMAEASDQIDLKLVLRDENLALMDLFLTNGARAIPKLIALDDELDVLFTWGARPSTATKMVTNYKAEHGKLDENFKKDLQIWYNKDKGADIQHDFMTLLEQSPCQC